MEQKTYTVERRKRILINTDPQRRCYNGCHYKSEWQWTPWEELEVGIKGIEERLIFWQRLADYAVSQRGESARQEFRQKQEQKTYLRLGDSRTPQWFWSYIMINSFENDCIEELIKNGWLKINITEEEAKKYKREILK